MTKKEIELYIELDNKIKNRIVKISHALHCISGIVIRKFVPDFRYWNLDNYDKEDFIENTQQDEELHLGLDLDFNDDDGCECNFSKCLLTNCAGTSYYAFRLVVSQHKQISKKC